MQVEGPGVFLLVFFSISVRTLSGLKGWMPVAKESFGIIDSTGPPTVYASPFVDNHRW